MTAADAVTQPARDPLIGMVLDEAYRIENECAGVVMRTDDAKEGPKAFMEKREPRFTGR